MRGSRFLTTEEILQLRDSIKAVSQPPVARRTDAVLMMALGTGFRRSEVISLQVGQIFQHGMFSGSVYLQRVQSKGKRTGTLQPIPPETATSLMDWIEYLKADLFDPQQVLFPVTRSTSHPRPNWDRYTHIKCNAYQKVMQLAVKHAGLSGRVTTHSMRKTFGMAVYKATGNNVLAAKMALRHDTLISTLHYLSVGEEEVHEAIMNVFGSMKDLRTG